MGNMRKFARKKLPQNPRNGKFDIRDEAKSLKDMAPPAGLEPDDKGNRLCSTA